MSVEPIYPEHGKLPPTKEHLESIVRSPELKYRIARSLVDPVPELAEVFKTIEPKEFDKDLQSIWKGQYEDYCAENLKGLWDDEMATENITLTAMILILELVNEESGLRIALGVATRT